MHIRFIPGSGKLTSRRKVPEQARSRCICSKLVSYIPESSRCTGTGILEEDIIQLLWVESSDALDDPSTSMG